MARPIKQGLDYYPLDVGFLQDVKIRRIMRACGIQSIPVLISLLANIYRNDGYFLRWSPDMSFLIADELGVSEGAVTATVDKAVQVDFFNANMYECYGVLTSEGIQSRFFEAASRRREVRYDARFLLINVNVYKNLVNVDNNPVNVDDNPQSKVKESKVKKKEKKGLPLRLMKLWGITVLISILSVLPLKRINLLLWLKLMVMLLFIKLLKGPL